MDAAEAVRTLLAVRQYDDKRVPAELVRRIVDAAHLTASSMNKQPWHFIVVQEPDTLKRLGQLARTGPYIAQAPLAIVVAVEKSSQFGISDASRAIQDMMLVAWSEGLASNWVGFGGLDEVGKLLGVPPEFQVFAIVPFGYAQHALGRGKKERRPRGEVVSRERFGQPFT